MKRSDFNQLWEETNARCQGINRTKGNDYAGDEDALRNFKEVAARTGMTPLQCWGVYFSKHIMAIETFISDGKVESEPIGGRIDDCITYLHLLHGLLKEANEEPVAKS